MQINAITKLGTTKLMAEYLMAPFSQKQIKIAKAPMLQHFYQLQILYIRKFNGGYIMPHKILEKSINNWRFKCDWYNPNKNVSKR